MPTTAITPELTAPVIVALNNGRLVHIHGSGVVTVWDFGRFTRIDGSGISISTWPTATRR